MEINFKKWFIIIGLTIGGGIYISDHYTFKDALAYSRKNPSPAVSPRIDYYVGMAYYLRDDNSNSALAFEQLLTDYPTSYYAPLAMIRLGTVYTQGHEWQSARDVYQRYMDEYPKGESIESVTKKHEFVKFK